MSEKMLTRYRVARSDGAIGGFELVESNIGPLCRASDADALLAERDAEILRLRTTGHGAAHELDNIAVECGLGHSPKPGDVAAHVRKLCAEYSRACEAVMLVWGGIMPENSAWVGDIHAAAEHAREEGCNLHAQLTAKDAEIARLRCDREAWKGMVDDEIACTKQLMQALGVEFGDGPVMDDLLAAIESTKNRIASLESQLTAHREAVRVLADELVNVCKGEVGEDWEGYIRNRTWDNPIASTALRAAGEEGGA